jgi:sugar lactone lactonase YvrE
MLSKKHVFLKGLIYIAGPRISIGRNERSPMQPEVVAATRDLVGESPRWDGRTARLVWVDAERPVAHAYNPATSDLVDYRLPAAVSSLALRASGGYVATGRDGLWEVNQDFGVGHLLAELGPLPESCLVNDSCCDPAGRLWVGIGSETEAGIGRVDRFNCDGGLETLLTGYSLPNGIGWSPGGTTMYLADSYQRRVFAFPYEIGIGMVGERRVLYRANEQEGLPDGLAVDSEGGVWVAFWGGGCVRRLGPSGQVLATIALPVRQVASVTFGGAVLDHLYITTASHGLSSTSGADGALFQVTSPVAGLPPAFCSI